MVGGNKKFIMTDYAYDINCVFEGSLNVEFKEGETAIITGYCPNIANK